MSRVGIIGGGPGGLSLAHDLGRRGHCVTLFEASSELGGLARSFRFGDIRIERYYHFICADDSGYISKLEELGRHDALDWRNTKMGFFFNGQLYPFSSVLDLLRFDGISFSGRIRYAMFVLYCILRKRWDKLDGMPAEKWLVRVLGRETYLATWYPLLSVKFSAHHDQISAAWIWHRIHRIARSRKTFLQKEQLGYLKGGTDVLIDALAEEAKHHQVSIHTDCPVKKILIRDGRACGVETQRGEEHLFDCVISCVPLPVYVRMIPDAPEDYLEKLRSIEFIGVICLTLRLKHQISENYWLNVNDPRIGFSGCIEYTNLNDSMTPDGSSILYVPYYLPRDHAWFRRSDEELLEDCLKSLAAINPSFREEWLIDWRVSRDPFAQVICSTGFAARVPGSQTPIDGLYLLESSQLYPSDRTISGTIDLASSIAGQILAAEGSGGTFDEFEQDQDLPVGNRAQVACIACGCESHRVFAGGSRGLVESAGIAAAEFGSSRRSVEPVTVLQCLKCGLGQQFPQPDPQKLIAAYSTMADPKYVSESRQRRRTQRSYVRLLRQHLPAGWSGPLLDVGCGVGLFLDLAAAEGWEAHGVEASEVLSAEAKRKHGDRVTWTTFEDAAFEAGSFEAICMWDLLEHVIDPPGVIEKAARLLRPGGLLALNVPNIESRVARTLGARWPLLLPEHLYYFSPESLCRLLRSRGFSEGRSRAHVVYFSLDYVFHRCRQHRIPGSRLASAAVRFFRLGRLAIPLLMGEVTLIARRHETGAGGDA